MRVLNPQVLTRWAISLIAVFVVASCAPVSRDNLEKQVLEADPSFVIVMDKRRELNNRIQTFKRELGLKRTAVEENILDLRKDLAEATSSVRQKISEIKGQMKPDRERLELELSIASEKLKSLRAQQASLGRSISQLQKALKQQESLMLEQERESKSVELNTLLAQAEKLDLEMNGVKEQVRLAKIKLLIIKL